MQTRAVILASSLAAASLAISGAITACAQLPGVGQDPVSGQSSGQGQGLGQQGRGRGMGGFPAGARGTLGTVTEVAPDHYTIKTDTGEILTVYYSVNTRIVKQGPGSGQGSGQGRARRNQGTNGETGEHTQPQSLKPTDIKVGDIITAGGEEDAAKKSIGAIFIAQIDPERAKQMREMQANYGKTWLAGRITGIEGTTITINGMIDHAKHTIEVDENTSFRRRRDSITLADIQPGQQLRAEGGVKGNIFLATVVNAMEPRNMEPRSMEPRNMEPRNRNEAPGVSPAGGPPATPQPQ